MSITDLLAPEFFGDDELDDQLKKVCEMIGDDGLAPAPGTPCKTIDNGSTTPPVDIETTDLLQAVMGSMEPDSAGLADRLDQIGDLLGLEGAATPRPPDGATPRPPDGATPHPPDRATPRPPDGATPVQGAWNQTVVPATRDPPPIVLTALPPTVVQPLPSPPGPAEVAQPLPSPPGPAEVATRSPSYSTVVPPVPSRSGPAEVATRSPRYSTALQKRAQPMKSGSRTANPTDRLDADAEQRRKKDTRLRRNAEAAARYRRKNLKGARQAKSLQKELGLSQGRVMQSAARVHEVKVENERLRAENERLRAENERLRAENERLLARPGAGRPGGIA